MSRGCSWHVLHQHTLNWSLVHGAIVLRRRNVRRTGAAGRVTCEPTLSAFELGADLIHHGAFGRHRRVTAARRGRRIATVNTTVHCGGADANGRMAWWCL